MGKQQPETFRAPPLSEDARLDDALARTRPSESRDAARSRRKRDVRARTVSVNRMSRYELRLLSKLYPPDEDAPPRPRTRAECVGTARPCPFVSCHHHLYLDVSARNGSIKLNFPDIEPDELPESCALDVADRGGATLERTGELVNLTRERVRQMEVKALSKVLAAADTFALRDFAKPGVAKRRLPVLAPSDDRFDVDHFASDALDAE